MKEVKKNQRGITLVALVVTIVVLLILAGVTIAFVMNNNGIINRATEARDQSETGNVRELVSVALMSTQTDFFAGKVDKKGLGKSLQDELKGVGLGCETQPTLTPGEGNSTLTGNAEVTLNGYRYTVTINTAATTPEAKITVSEGTKI